MSSSAGPESRQHLLRPQDLLCPPTRTPRRLRALRCIVQQPCKTSFPKDTQSVQSQCGVGPSAAGLSDRRQLETSLAPASTNAHSIHYSLRSEERRVGKEGVSTWRDRWSAEH